MSKSPNRRIIIEEKKNCEEGVDVAVTHLAIIETDKMYGLEIRDYLAHVFRENMNGNEDCSTYAPEASLT